MARKTQAELAQNIEAAKQKVEVGAIYAHYKHGDEYRVVDVVVNCEAADEVMVIYEALYGDHLHFARALSDWCETPEKDGVTVPRFAKVT